MDRIEKKRHRETYANTRSVSDGDAAALESITGRENDRGAEPGELSAEDIAKPVGARPRSEVTGRHDPGSGANQTVDGLDATEEATRRNAEDLAQGEEERDGDLPVFDRGDTLPRI